MLAHPHRFFCPLNRGHSSISNIMSTITPLHQIDLESGHLTKPSWSPNGRLLAIPAQSGSITIFDLDREEGGIDPVRLARSIPRSLGSEHWKASAVGSQRPQRAGTLRRMDG